jgi:uncharacterized protein (TIGR00297 family)
MIIRTTGFPIQSTMHFFDPAPASYALLLSAGIATAGWRARSLSGRGAIAAVVVGTAGLSASWGNGALLVCWFVLAALLSALGRQRKAGRVRHIVAKPHARDALQVLANGAVFAMASVGMILARSLSGIAEADIAQWRTMCGVAAAAALAAAGADTWATEIGTLYGKAPWSLRLRSRVPAGTSGAITVIGTIAMIAGAAVVAIMSVPFVINGGESAAAVSFMAILLGGVCGAFSDTLIGAWLQQRRWCPRCGMETEQLVHTCGTTTAAVAGPRVLDNDAVNFLCTLVGALVAVGIASTGLAR